MTGTPSSPRSGLPSLGPRGEGWLAVQIVLFWFVVAVGWGIPAVVAPPLLVAPGVAAIVVGMAVAATSALRLRQRNAFTALPHPRPKARLVDDGPYAVVRHPIYAGIVLAGLGWALVRGSVAALAVDTVLFVFFDLKRRREESWLVDLVDGYAAYMQRTRALVPFVY